MTRLRFKKIRGEKNPHDQGQGRKKNHTTQIGTLLHDKNTFLLHIVNGNLYTLHVNNASCTYY